jgi:hypothetical protein
MARKRRNNVHKHSQDLITSIFTTFMSVTAETIVSSFGRLSTPEQQTVLNELLRRYKGDLWGEISDDEMLLVAEAQFLALDKEEAEYEARSKA